MRACLVSLLVVAFAATAHAGGEVVILGPAGAEAPAVTAALGAVKDATLGSRVIDASCALDASCLVTAGSELGARRVLAVHATEPTRLTLTLVDVAAGVLIGTRDVTLPAKRIGKELPGLVRAFVDDAIVAKSKALFDEGKRHYNLGEFEPALEKYKLAYRIKAHPAFQFNIAQCHRKLGQHRDAIAMYQAYLVGVPDADNKPLVDSLIAEETQALAAEQAADAAREREREQQATERTKAEAARKIREAEAEARAEAARAEQARIAAERAREREYDQHPARRWTLITGAAGLVTAGVGGYFAYRVRDRQSQYDDTCDAELHPPDVIDACLADIDAGRRDARMANVLIGVGGGVALASLIVYIVDPGNVDRPARAAERAAVRVSPSSVQVVIRW